jgi:hypothetical protein
MWWFYRRTDETEHKLRPEQLSSGKDLRDGLTENSMIDIASKE